jgi:hypothetical protein
MDIIGFVCVPLGSSTVQFHARLGSRCAFACSEAGFSSQNGDRARGVCYRRAEFYCAFFFCGQKDSMQRMFIKKCFLFTVGSVCRVKRFTAGLRNVADLSRLLCLGFRCTGKVIRQVYQCCSRNKCFFQFRISHVFRFISICELFTDSPS